MESNLDILFVDTELPSVDVSLSIDTPDKTDVGYHDVPEIAENQILAEGAADLEDHPQLEPFLETLHKLKNEFHQKVVDASQDYELSGFAKVLFSIRKKV